MRITLGKIQCLLAAFACGFSLQPEFAAQISDPVPANPYVQWKMGPPHEDSFFPIAVWLQNPQKANRYKEAGFNTYVALWAGPTDEQLATLKKSGMKVICRFNETGRKHLDDPTIIGWMHGDEPDNAQSLGKAKGYGPPIAPSRIQESYQAIHEADPQRPVMLNLGQGVAWDNWRGRGVRTRHSEDYPEYVKGSDIVSFDIYPVAHSNPEVSGKLWYVPKGVERLERWTEGKKIIWNCIECTRIETADKKATPQQVRCEVWMSLIHGSMGLIYFVHEWKPKFNESALLADSQMLNAISNVNHQIQRLAPVLNCPSVPGAVTALASNTNVPIAVMSKQYKGDTYIFAVGMRDGSCSATLTLPGQTSLLVAEVIGENRKLKCENGVFRDDFNPWDVHIYRLAHP